MNNVYRSLVIAVSLLAGSSALAADDFSVAEKRVFLDDHLKNIRHSTTLGYSFQQQAETAEDSFEDKADVVVKVAGKGLKTTTVDFLGGTHRISLPEVEDAKANPVILYFLEMDVRDMHRLVGGQEAYFRKRIRLALVEGATVKPVTVKYQGHSVAASEVLIKPYADDPLKARFGKYFTKSYVFTISDKVPGSVFEIRTQVDDPAATAAGAVPIMKTVLSLKTAAG